MNKDNKGRPYKDKLEYFSHDVDMRNDEALTFLCAKYKSVIPYAMFTLILEMIYGNSTGYFLTWNERAKVLISDKLYTTFENTNDILNDALNEELFNRNLFDSYNILTSEKVQKRYIHMVERRRKVIFTSEYLLVNPIDHIKAGAELIKYNGIYLISINTPNKPPVNVPTNTLNVPFNTPQNNNNDTLRVQSKSKSKSKSNTLSLSEILQNSEIEIEKIPELYKNYLQTNNFNRAAEIEKINLRLADQNISTELYNAMIECRNLATNYVAGPVPDKISPASFEILKEKLTGKSWQETICMNYGFQFEDFRDFAIDWIERKRLTNGWQYPSNSMASYMIDDYKKKLAKDNKPAAKTKQFNAPAVKANPFTAVEETFNSLMNNRNNQTYD